MEHITNLKSEFRYEDIFTFSKNWSFSKADEEKNEKYVEFIDRIVNDIPENIFQRK
jgi:hypothetical protein